MTVQTVADIEYEPLCPVLVCPFPADPDWHLCIICGAQAVDHQHVDARRMGGSKRRDVPENIVMLCRTHHEERTLNKWRDEIRVTAVGRWYIQIFGDDTAKAYPLPASSPVAEPSEDDLPRGIAGSAAEPGAGAAISGDEVSGDASRGTETLRLEDASPSETGASVPDSGRKAAPPSSARDASQERYLHDTVSPAAMTVPSTPSPLPWSCY